MQILRIINIVLLIALLVLGIETIIKFNKNKDKFDKDVKKSLIMRIDILMILSVLIAIITIANIVIANNMKVEPQRIEPTPVKPSNPTTYDDREFNIKLIKTVNSTLKSNYLISPYSIEVALNMLKEGAKDNTYNEINNLVNRTINDVSNDKVKVANAIFVKNKFRNYIEETFYNSLISKYNSEILYNEFKTPDVINNWVNKHTDNMIPKILDIMDKDFVLGLANAIAIDVEWLNEFECENTSNREFTKIDNSKINVEMMHQTYEYGNTKYFDFENITGIVIPYENDLEFVGIIPDNINNYIENLTNDKLNAIDNNLISASNKLHIMLSLPRFSYSFSLNNFKSILISMGIKDVFDPANANLTGIITRDNLGKLNGNYDNIYVDEAIHKTYIDLNEKGTKAAAVTYFGIKANATAIEDYDIVNIEFNKPFIYMIRDTKNKEILFFGVVYEPNIWNGSTCSEK